MKDLQPGRRIIIFTLASGQCSHVGKTNRGRRRNQLAAKPRVAKGPLPRRAGTVKRSKQTMPQISTRHQEETEGQGTGDESSCSRGACSKRAFIWASGHGHEKQTNNASKQHKTPRRDRGPRDRRRVFLQPRRM